MKVIYIPVSVNYYKGESTRIGGTGFKTVEACKRHFDNNHNCSDNFCDYCNTKWGKSYGQWIKKVDHDGACVEYKVHEVTIFKYINQ